MADESHDTLHGETKPVATDPPTPSRPVAVPGLVILHHPEAHRVGEHVALPALAAGETVWLSRLEPGFVDPEDPASTPKPLGDAHLSRRPMLLTPGPTPGSVAIEVAGSPTRVEVGGRRLAPSQILTASEVDRGVVVELGKRIVLLLHRCVLVPEGLPAFGMVGSSAAMVTLRQEVRAAAELDVPTLVRGATGTGKELVARALHAHGPRQQGPFVAVNLGALAPSLAAAELFGAERGAYTGAERRRQGLFAEADGGVLFLDEIGEAPAEVQVLLLRVLEEGLVQPVGGTERRRVDVRVVAATDAGLEAAVEAGRFRAPLLHRLMGYEVELPPLRQRRDDIARLAVHFLRQELGRPPWQADEPWLTTNLVSRLVAAAWPGNVRQLQNVVRRLATAHKLGTLDELFLDDLIGPAVGTSGALPDPHADPAEDPSHPPSRSARGASIHPSSTKPGAAKATADEPLVAVPRRWLRRPSEVSDDELLATLAEHRWQLRPTARALGVSRTTLYRLIDACPQIRKAVELEPGEIEAALRAARGDHLAAALTLQVSPQGLKRRITALGL